MVEVEGSIPFTVTVCFSWQEKEDCMLEKWIVKAVPEVVTDWSIVGTKNTKEEALALARRLDREYFGCQRNTDF